MSVTATAVATRLNLATVTQYLSSQESLAASLTGGGRRHVVLLRSTSQWDGPDQPVWGEGRAARIAAAPSALAVHELIIDHLADGAAGPLVLVILTDREESELDPAILARAHKKRVSAVDRWDVIREAFGAGQVDPRLKDDNWAAEALLDATPPGGWRPLGGGLLSRRTALTRLVLRRLRLGAYGEASTGLQVEPAGQGIDAHTLLGWSLAPGGPERFLALRGPERAGLTAFIAEEDQAGLAGRALLTLVGADHGHDAVAFGLVCSALWRHADPDADVYRARGRAERWFGEQTAAAGEQVDALASTFGKAAEEYLTAQLAVTARDADGDRTEEIREARRISDTVLDRASSLVRQFGAESAAATSPVLPAGLDARFTAVGKALAEGANSPLSDAVRALTAHARAYGPETRARIERARMGQRLAQWLASDPAADSDSVSDAIERHITETGWVDRALEYIEAGGDSDPVLKAAYGVLAARVQERRHEIDRDFARKLAIWTETGTPPRSMLTVETFLDRVVKPVLRGGTGRRVLLLILDGMSAAIASELGEELRATWAEYDPLNEGAPQRRAMAAALPTVTAVSRTSLLTGKLSKGAQADEKRLFPGLALWGRQKAAVFHKDDLETKETGDPFGPALLTALTDGESHVAVVLNTIDDRLAKEQKLGDGAWRAEHIPALLGLLRIAASEGMAVLVTSDHGHVVDRHGTKIDSAAPESARHRAPGGALHEAEVALFGPRVVWPEPGASIVALWDADSRYTSRKAGYHGGASLAEFAIPVLAFLPFGAEPPNGWRELGDQRPDWWFSERPEPQPAAKEPEAAVPVVKKPTRQKPVTGQAAQSRGVLFDVALVPAAEDSDALLTPASVIPGDDMVSLLLASEVFHDQLELLARKPQNLDKIEQAIRALLDSGGTLPATALAQRIGYPPARADGFAAVLRQLLNYDGVQVLETLPDGRTLRLQPQLLRSQFGLT
ncbi:BREX-2 system phosphatase PglZ [Streptomyces sp. NPDC059679]|uniref:BREX-2 system phosphatase PglZ n=1 Tax=Streptomyces sp. NPDC059679 TaxID=3346903 RepID=UPI0036D07849